MSIILKKRIKKFLVFYIFLCVTLLTSYTLAKYVKTVDSTSAMNIAKFNVSINDVNVTEGEPIIFNPSTISNLTVGKIAPSTKGYFEFIINPSDTEVSLEYEFKFDFEQLGPNFKLSYYTINDTETQYNITDGNMVKNNLLLSNNNSGFTSDDVKTLKVYWSWDSKNDMVDPSLNDINNKDISVVATVKQKID